MNTKLIDTPYNLSSVRGFALESFHIAKSAIAKATNAQT